MSNYTKTVDFAAKDGLSSGASGKLIKGTEFETEFDNIVTAIATKADIAGPIYATDLIIGEDAQTAIDFGTPNEIDFKADNAARLTLTASALYPVTNNQIDLGTASLEFKDAFFDGTVTADAFAGPLTGNVTGNASGTCLLYTSDAADE